MFGARGRYTTSCTTYLRCRWETLLSSPYAPRQPHCSNARPDYRHVLLDVRSNVPLEAFKPSQTQIVAGLRQTHAEEMQQLTGLIERFITSLPKMEASLEPHAVCHLLVIYTQAHVAMILLYRNSVEIPGTIPRRCLDAARAVSTQVIGPVDMQQLHYVDPILAVSEPYASRTCGWTAADSRPSPSGLSSSGCYSVRILLQCSAPRLSAGCPQLE